jgi:hypothetical protein
MLILVLACAGIGLALAQQRVAAQQRSDEKSYALNWLQGRFRAPVRCARADGSRLDLEEAISIRPGPDRSGMPTLRLTFFGIDVPDATKCFNVVESRVPDRRGLLYVTYRSHSRTDMGLTDFRRTLKKGEVVYYIVGGGLRIREVGTGAEPRKIRFEDRDYPLRVKPVQAHSDGDKLLAPYREEHAGEEDRRRRLRFEIEGPEEFTFSGAFIEDDHWRR